METPQTEEYWTTGPLGGIQIKATNESDAIQAYMDWAKLLNSDGINTALMVEDQLRNENET